MPEICVILPTYNEAENIVEMIEQVVESLEGEDYEILVVDDDSPDGTSRIVTGMMDRFANLRLLVRTKNRGLVNSINNGIKNTDSAICVWMDADLSMPAPAIKSLVTEIRAGADMALGSRYIEGGGFKGADSKNRSMYRTWWNLKHTEDSFLSVVISWTGNKVVRFFLDSAYSDYSSGFYAVRRHVFDHLALEGEYLEYCIHLLYSAVQRGFRVVEVPVIIKPRKRGVSKTANDLQTLVLIAINCFHTVRDLISKDREGKWRQR